MRLRTLCMTTLQTFRAKLERQPFRPFVVEFSSGSTLVIVEQAEVLLPKTRPELVIVFSADGIQHEFEIGAILRLSEAV